MTEKVISEIRLIETDDGYRIEMKGDKENLKKMGFTHKGFGPGRCFGRRRGRPRKVLGTWARIWSTTLGLGVGRDDGR
jgi:hypothetical protein